MGILENSKEAFISFFDTDGKIREQAAQRQFDALSPEQKIYQRIKMKKNKGFMITKGESDFEKKFLGVDEDKGSTKDLKSEDRVRLRNMAKEIAQNDYGAKYQKMSMNGDVGDQPKDYEVSEYDILKNLPRAAKFLYPNLMFDEFTETPGAVHPLDIQLPGTIKKASQAMDHLMKEYKMDEPQARQWIQERL